MDCQMPEMDGYEATQQIRGAKAGEIYKNIPIIAMTANAMQGDKEKCLHSGMDDYISKPINNELLIQILTKHLQIEAEPTLETEQPDSLVQEHNTHQGITNDKWNKEELLQRVYQNQDLFDTLLETFIRDSEKDLIEIENAIKQEDFKAISMISHTVKGVSGQLCAPDLQAIAKDIEQIAEGQLKQRSDYKLSEHLKLFRSEVAALCEIFKECLSSSAPKNNDSDVELSHDELVTRLDELDAKIERSDYIDPEFLSELKTINQDDSQLQSLVKTLIEHVNLFDNTAASATLKDIRNYINTK